MIYECVDASLGAAVWKQVADTNSTQTLTNKTINGSNNTITNVSLTTGVTGTLPVANGGTGLTSPGTSGNLLTSDGTNWVSSPPSSTALYNYISGLIPTSVSATTNANAAITFSEGAASDSANTSMLAATTLSWAVSNGNNANGYQGGTTLPNSSTIHFYVIATAADGAWSATFASTSLAPTLPGSYTKYRRIFSHVTDGSGVLRAVSKCMSFGGGGLISFLTTHLLDINGANPGTGSRTLYTLTVPSGIPIRPLYRANPNTLTSAQIIFTSPDEADVAPSSTSVGNYYSYFTASPGFDGSGNAGTGGGLKDDGVLITNTSAQIGCRANSTIALYFVTRGWVDTRGM